MGPAEPFEYDQDYFDRHLASRFYRWQIGYLRNRTIYRLIRRQVRQGRFLEIGFGDDRLLKIFAREFEVYGIDISRYAVARMLQRYPTGRFAVGDVSVGTIPFPGPFDVICSINTVEHLTDPVRALGSMREALKPSGVLAVYMPTNGNILSRAQYRCWYDVPEHVFRPSIPDLIRLFRNNGMTLVEEYAASFFPFRISSRLFTRSTNLYCALFRRR